MKFFQITTMRRLVMYSVNENVSEFKS